jgi:hypothetical protein
MIGDEKKKAVALFDRAKVELKALKKIMRAAADLAALCTTAPIERIWLPADTDRLSGAVARFNEIDRAIAETELEHFGITLNRDGLDISIYNTQSPPLGLGVLWLPIVAGVSVIAGVLATIGIQKAVGTYQRSDYAARLLAADERMMAADPQTRATWAEWKKQNQKQIDSIATKEPGLIDRLSSGLGSLGQLAIGAALVFVALNVFAKKGA